MKQVLQSLRTGAVEVPDVPCPAPRRGEVLIRTRATLISSGTERMLLEFGKANWIEKARQQPDKLRMVLEKVRTDGLAATLESVKAKLDEPVTLGYCNAGVVLEAGTSSFAVGDRVVSNGPHAEVVSVPRNLCARIPEGVSDEAAAFTVVGAIALQGIRLAQPTLGECFAVTGLGTIGLIAVQLLRANGCRVLAIDLDSRKLDLARRFGAETVNVARGDDPVSAAEHFSRGRGMDGVVITASTKSGEPVHQAALMCRKQGRIVLVGMAGLELSRDDFYKKELRFQVSCSYGPGRYDPIYEDAGQDYPIGYVRWTAQRNFEAVLDLIADGRLDVAPLVTNRFPFGRSTEAYDMIQSGEFHLGVLLEFSAEKTDAELTSPIIRLDPQWTRPRSKGNIAFIGAGSYASKTLIPAFQKAGAGLQIIASSGGLSAKCAGRKSGFSEASTDVDALIEDSRTDTVVIATRHDSHASLVCRALKAGKHVFVEKPLAIRSEEIDEIESLFATQEKKPLLMVGFNRRFSPHIVYIKELLANVKRPKAFVYTVNAGAVPANHWILDSEQGGGRVVSEACHFLDLLRFLAGAPIVELSHTVISKETMSISISFADSSIGTVHYLSNGNRSYPKERLEIFCEGRVLQLDNFRKLRGFGWPGFHGMNLWRQDKGAYACAAAFLKAVRGGGSAPIPLAELIEVARYTLRAANAL
jgi:predicted dehydrogenase/threonine dehydrogenase-like Zn-dependent dehydrogenase